MTHRIDVTLEKHVPPRLKVVPHAVRNSEAGEIFVDEWSEQTIERMFEAAKEALKEQH